MAKQRMSTLDRLKVVEGSLQSRALRVRKRFFAIVQSALAAGLAFWVASEVVGHHLPFFAPISVVIVLGFTGGDRIKRALDMSFGCVVGVLLGDLLFANLGAGGWQIALAVGISLITASFLTSSVLVNNQVAIGSILIATIMSPDAATTGVDRTIDAIIGSTIGLLTIALLPSSPLASARHELSKLLGISSSVLDDVADGLRNKDASLIEGALRAIRGTQNDIDKMLEATRSGTESAQLSPFLWGARRYVRSMGRTVAPADNVVRNVRVLARRAMVLVQDGDSVSERQLEIIDALAKYTLDLSDVFEVGTKLNQATEIPILVNQLRKLGSEASMDVVDDDSVLSAYVVLAQSRSVIVDLLQICGMSRASSMAVLAPTSDTPAYPPELWEE
ncbi:FUSC family protein [Corynebacterium cystitidis]|uniref:FUSC family protein n=1 Tax=Corynebacterium cystitidis TaxID=35757 RepID=UPI00211E409C|nr:FUSC family protein [Corynebacterium cystitidis]